MERDRNHEQNHGADAAPIQSLAPYKRMLMGNQMVCGVHRQCAQRDT
jgi:hypothetical protein